MEVGMRHLTVDELEAGLERIRQSPADQGVLESIVVRPRNGERRQLEHGVIDLVEGLVGDNWSTRGSSHTPDRRSHPAMQLTIMNSRTAALVARTPDRWSLAGDQLYVDLDLSTTNLPPGTRLSLGETVIEVTDQPHTGCKKFVSRFGIDAMKFVNSAVGRELNLRGINLRVLQPGVIRVRDIARKLAG